MNWLEFVLLFVAGCLFVAAVMAIMLFSLWTIKTCVREMVKIIQELVSCTQAMKSKLLNNNTQG